MNVGRALRGALPLAGALVGLLVLVSAPRGEFAGAGGQAEPPTVYAYPSPPGWPQAMVPPGHPSTHATPSAIVRPCPSWAPTLIRHADGTFECRARVPAPAYIVNPCPAGEVVKEAEPGVEYCASSSS